MKDRALKAAGAIFLVIAILQISRVVIGFEATVNGHAVPVWINAVAAAVMLGLSVWMFRAAK
jgi:hypothetical protein